MLDFIAYGLSIFLYTRAQRDLGAAKTSAYYAVAPFIGAFLAFVVNDEKLTFLYFVGLIFMLIGSLFVVYDTIVKHHSHEHIREPMPSVNTNPQLPPFGHPYLLPIFWPKGNDNALHEVQDQ